MHFSRIHGNDSTTNNMAQILYLILAKYTFSMT